MGINFAPKWPSVAASKAETTGDEDIDALAAFGAEEANHSRLASGWWILPFAAAGLIECYFAIDWIFAQL